MPRTRSISPKYRRKGHQAIVTLTDPSGKRRDYLLGPWKSAESRAEYGRLLAEWHAAGMCIPHVGPGPSDLTVNELILRFWQHAKLHYRHADGTPTSEQDGYRHSLRPLKALYGHTLAREFTPLALKAVRQNMIDAGLARRLINQRIGRVRRLFRWATGEGLLPATIFHALGAVDGLSQGRTNAPETEPVRPVPSEIVERTIPFLSRTVAGMVRFQRLTGCRPQDVCNLRRCEIDMSGPVWFFRPVRHKNAWRGKSRTIAIGPQAQAVLADFPTEEPEAYVFSPARTMAERRTELRSTRVSSVQPSQICRAIRNPKKTPGDKYTPRSYHQAVRNACIAEGIPRWFPNQLRHTRGTEVRKQYGLEAAQVTLGHAHAKTTEIYAESNATLASRVALETG